MLGVLLLLQGLVGFVGFPCESALAVAAAIIFRVPRFREYARRVFSRKE